jgi:hypothetical protein
MATDLKVYSVEDADPESSSGIPAGTFPGTLAGLLDALDAARYRSAAGTPKVLVIAEGKNRRSSGASRTATRPGRHPRPTSTLSRRTDRRTEPGRGVAAVGSSGARPLRRGCGEPWLDGLGGWPSLLDMTPEQRGDHDREEAPYLTHHGDCRAHGESVVGQRDGTSALKYGPEERCHSRTTAARPASRAAANSRPGSVTWWMRGCR